MTETRTETPDEVLERLMLLYPDRRRKKSFGILHQVCLAITAKRTGDFTPQAVGTLSKQHGGVGVRALLNRSGRPFLELIAAHERAAAPTVKNKPVAVVTSQAVSSASSPLQRGIIQALEYDCRRLEAALAKERRRANGLQHLANQRAVITLPGDGSLDKADPGLRASLDLADPEKRAIEQVLSPRWRRTNGLDRDAFARLVDTAGTKMSPPGLLSALEKVAEALGLNVGR